nr:Cytochrome C oxidase, cbb3-type, subunit III [uncultured bacterium]
MKGDPKRGAQVFKAANCIMCHPGGGNALEPAKPLKGASFLKKYPTDESVARQIREGSKNGTMPSFRKDVLTDQQLVDVISYVRALTPPMKKVVCPPVKLPVKTVTKQSTVSKQSKKG